jgi:hypothetical protein
MPRKKTPATPEIDPGTFRLVAQCLKHYATPGTTSISISSSSSSSSSIFSRSRSSGSCCCSWQSFPFSVLHFTLPTHTTKPRPISLSLTKASLTVRRGDLNARSRHGARFHDNGFLVVDLLTQPCKSRLPVLRRTHDQTSVSSCEDTCHGFTWRIPFVEHEFRALS